MSPIPSHVTELLTPLFPPGTSFTLSHSNQIHPSALPTSPTTFSGIYLYKSASLPALQLKGEIESMKRMKDGVGPRVVGDGELDGKVWCCTEWHDLEYLKTEEHQERLAELLAELHLSPVPERQQFGFPVPTYCGVTEQDNTQEDTWAKFYSKRRIENILRRIGDDELSAVGAALVERVIPRLLENVDVRPSLLHGDLWSGNVAFSKNNKGPFTFDPASYYGHSEADLGITHMFGGFTSAFYSRYHEVIPRSHPVEEYEQRMWLYELYHHLNHTLMFGRSYKGGSLRLISKLVDWYKQAEEG
ncbi:Ketosamine-3-kinase [Meredithblackwellia eburnea MCA 4105]